MDNQITYIFGAGASSQSMPMVSNFTERFRFFQNFLNDLSGKKVKHFKSKCDAFISEVENHLSFDTFFKKLFHNEKVNLTESYKKVLLVYFIFEHFVEYTKDLQGSQILYELGKRGCLDPRYDALIAGLLRPIRNSSFFTKVNFITWNYDLNLMMSLKNFFLDNQSLQYIIEHKTNGNNKCFAVSTDSIILHLNGLIYYPGIHNIAPLKLEHLKEYIEQIIDKDFIGKEPNLNEHANFLNFAWENYDNAVGATQPQFLRQAKDAVFYSSNIVIVGYSFPLYNRLVDLFFLNSSTLTDKNIYIQDPDADNLINTFKESIIPRTRARWYPIKEVRSFYVPKDVFI